MEQSAIGIILSTGRTGTQFFEFFMHHYINNAICLHEPHPSRRFKFYSNLSLKNRLKEDFITKQFYKLRSASIKNNDRKKYIESNNFLFGCIPALNKAFNVQILHLVRDPRTYIVSHLKHGFWSGHKKFTAKYVPYWLENIELPKEDRNNPCRILARRWMYVNQVIERYHLSNDYLLIRFEDLFSNDTRTSVETLQRIIDFFKLEIKKGADLEEALQHKQNVGTKKEPDIISLKNEEQNIVCICNPLMKKYQYL